MRAIEILRQDEPTVTPLLHMSQMKEALNAAYAPEAESAPTREMMFDWINNNTPYCSRQSYLNPT